MTQYIIVKHADDSSYEFYFDYDPKKCKVHISHSAFYSFTGKNAEIHLVYNNKKEAEKDCKKMNEINPVGCYAVCEVLEESLNEVM